MIRILSPSDFVTSPWKNGGGVTHEIARAEKDGRWLWRLSIAEVASDGPFSRFDGLSRILTVIEGAGIDLETPGGVLAALPFAPVAFHGETPVTGRLKAGPIRDLNVIFDATRFPATVTLLDGMAAFNLPGMGALVLIRGAADLGGRALAAGEVALGEGLGGELGAGARGLLVRLG